MDPERTGISSEQFAGVLRRRAVWILLCLLLVGGATYGFSKRETKKYTATASVAFNSNQLAQQIAGLSAGGGSSNSTTQENSDVELVRVGDTAAKTAKTLNHGLTPEAVSSSLSISGKEEANIVDVSATSTSPTLAAAIANTYVSEFVKGQQSANRQFFRSALALVNKQLAGLTRAQRAGTDGADLEGRAHTLGLLAELDYRNVEIAAVAAVPTSPSSPKTKSDTLVGAILGLLLGLGVALILERFDRRLRGPEDLAASYDLPLLGVVPNSTALSSAPREGARGTTLPPAEAEAFSLIRAHLRFFNIDRDLHTILIASPAPGDGKTTIARHLAEASARVGSRVLLLEVDLRQPTVAQQLRIPVSAGLAEVLIGDVPLDQAIRSVTLQAPRGEGISGRTLDVLTAGAILPPNPGELLESQAMDVVLERTRSAYDVIVIDTPPLIAVSDAFSLLTKVDGVVIVGRVGHSRSDVAKQLHQVLSSSGAPLLGVIANGAKSGGPASYSGYGKSSSAPAVSAGDAPRSEEFAASTNL